MMTLYVWVVVLGGGVGSGVAFHALSLQSKFLLVLLLVAGIPGHDPGGSPLLRHSCQHGPLSLAQAYSGIATGRAEQANRVG